ncbi:hypothetical protein EOI86_03960 [Hwanghaeella grinnelliae]|uniref:PBP domain-containing protein n=1 Tax=Hwanghaeella grinnelliae TaxID=2500179 RepID=A0A3S2Z9C9_9PROT|nr:substrate-binding domain-containing protein [Hwanghaeella grinnelliae]RVU38448.1 hypothetical protein EOI86_03960 [Hwanghaeella grinnelliae]
MFFQTNPVYLRAAFLALFLATSLGVSPSQAEIKIGGTGGDLGTWKKIAQAYKATHPETDITVLNSLGSGGGIKALAAGAIDLAISSRPLKAEEAAAGFKANAYGVTALALSSANDVYLEKLTIADVVEIYQRGTRRWPNGNPILVVMRPLHDTDITLVVEAFPEMGPAFDAAVSRGARIGASDQDAADALEETPTAVGFLSLSLILAEDRNINTFALNGVAPTTENLANGSYPISKRYYLVTPKVVPDETTALVDFLYSAQGQEILRDNGHLPIGRE